MFDQGKGITLIFIFLFLTSCWRKSDPGKDLTRNDKVFQQLQQLNDSIYNWDKNKLGAYSFLKSGKWAVDSVVCFNGDSSRLISCLFVQCREATCISDDIHMLFGEKIYGNWYYWIFNTVYIERKTHTKNISVPLTFSKLHQIALQEIYSNYLLPNGEINEAWFTTQFEGPGWYKWDETPEQIKKLTRKDFEQRHLEYVKRMWEGRDTSSIVP